MLEQFLKKVAGITHLYDSEDFQTFLKGPANYEQQSFPPIQYFGIYTEFQSKFRFHQSPEILPDRVGSLEADSQKLKEMTSMLSEFQNANKQMEKNYGTFVKQYDEMGTLLENFEEKCIVPYGGKPIYKGPDFANTRNPFEIIQEWIQGEYLDVQAMQESINTVWYYQRALTNLRKKLEDSRAALDKMKRGKTSIKSLFSTKSKATLLEQQDTTVLQLENDIEYATYIHKVIINKLYVTDLPEFKKQKAASYDAVNKVFSTIMADETETVLKACRIAESLENN